MNMGEMLKGTVGESGRVLFAVVAMFIALWFDPRISYLQRDISAVAEHANQIDSQGTRRSQTDIVRIEDKTASNTDRIIKVESKLDSINDKLTIILQKLSEHGK